MNTYGHKYPISFSQSMELVPFRPKPAPIRLTRKHFIIIGLLLLSSNLTTWWFSNPFLPIGVSTPAPPQKLYLIQEASKYIPNIKTFEKKVHTVAESLNIAPEWLMAVMYAESRFNPAVMNRRGSGAVGLIQFMVPAVKDLNNRLGTRLYMKDVRAMTATEQLTLVHAYLQMVRERYGDFESLTDLYLGILYPGALDHDYCHTLFTKPSRAYKQNAGLDENGDGLVTIGDIDKRMKRIFPTAYMAEI